MHEDKNNLNTLNIGFVNCFMFLKGHGAQETVEQPENMSMRIDDNYNNLNMSKFSNVSCETLSGRPHIAHKSARVPSLHIAVFVLMHFMN